ncbi:acyl carrier protein [Pseudonocardia nematodicida]|uniref:Acyl carrier protein n=1 Tax=Pseudonocardia nematodicida TaxID=1206997 RepID=A0ABV1K5K4_9PSEU
MTTTSAVPTSTLNRVRRIVEDTLAVSVVSVDADLVECGLLDSLGLVTVLGGLEDEFGGELPLDEFDPAAFRTIAGMAGFVQRSGVAEAVPAAEA